jgi:hypothetical protein
MNDAFEPRNELERQLLAAQEGRLGADDFLHALLEAQVFVPVQDADRGIANFQRSVLAQPLTLEAEDGTRVLVLFTSPERARTFLQDHPDYPGGLLERFGHVIERVGAGFGVALNPGLPVGLDMEPEMVERLRPSQALDAES